MGRSREDEILRTLRKTFMLPKRTTLCKEPFRTLVATIISQNTADRNTVKALKNLERRFQITPEDLVNAEKCEIEECLKVAGLYSGKAKTIKRVSRIVMDNFNGDLTLILSMPLDEARKTLIQFPGVGPKTADVVLLFCGQKPTIPVDTHVDRVSKRLHLAEKKGDYEAVRKSLQGFYDPEHYLAVHVLLISLGRSYCRARNPLCMQCPVDKFCPSKRIQNRSD